MDVFSVQIIHNKGSMFHSPSLGSREAHTVFVQLPNKSYSNNQNLTFIYTSDISILLFCIQGRTEGNGLTSNNNNESHFFLNLAAAFFLE